MRMTKDVTLEKFLLVYFQEADNQTVQDVMDALFTKPDLRDEWQEIVDILEALKSPIPTPSESSLKIIMDYSKESKNESRNSSPALDVF
ncbi:MAG: hypothetical protein CMN34_07590 [Saprospirales bacterium]|nr:hypothetical protein [Saprospirales bacterium]|tara:strand:- start:891 stop:1157 length:267 start_codon:yes stop_codon:yes gene_type:complete